MAAKKTKNRYAAIIEKIFFSKYTKGDEEVTFEREDLVRAAKSLRIKLPKNLGDVIYSISYRTDLPQRILKTQTKGKEWIIEGRGRAMYCFRLVTENRIVPNEQLTAIKVPDATPEIVSSYALSTSKRSLRRSDTIASSMSSSGWRRTRCRTIFAPLYGTWDKWRSTKSMSG